MKISKIQYLIPLGKMKISVSPLHILTSYDPIVQLKLEYIQW